MAHLVLEQLSDFGDYNGGEELREIFKLEQPNVRLSPDGGHIHVILRKPTAGLVTFDKYERPQLVQNQKKLDLWITRSVPIVDILYLDHSKSSSRGGAAATVVVVVFEDGKAEFWRFQESTSGWHLLQTSELCNSPRARVVSVCVSSNLIMWCEERPPSESSPSHCPPRSNLSYCVCRRDFDLQEGAVCLGGVKIALHNNPQFTVVSSGERVYLLPVSTVTPLSTISKFFLCWSPRHDSFTVSTTGRSTALRRLSAKESDFKKLVTDSLGFLSTLDPPEIRSFCPAACGGLLLLLSSGWLCLLQSDGTLRQVYELAGGGPVKPGAGCSLCLYQDTLALLLGQNLLLIDVNCGRELEKMVLKGEGLLYVNRAERVTPHLLTESGVFVVVNREREESKTKPPGFSAVESLRPGALLVEAVFEEACKYYQQRSLSSTQLTVDTLKKGGRFQAPISLASILRSYLSAGLRQKGAELSQNGGGQDKLMGSLEAELKALVSLEELKGSLVRGSVKEVEAVCASLVEKEVARLLSSELDDEALIYLNSIFSTFPHHVWRATQAALQLHYNGEGSLSTRAPPDVWKTVLSPSLLPSSPAAPPLTNGRPKPNHSLKGDHTANCKSKAWSSAPPPALNVFELLCHSLLNFQPSWLPRFLELAQQQQGSAGLGLSLAASSWGFSSGRGAEGGDSSNVPLYKRALCVLSGLKAGRELHRDLEVELLLVSGRPNAILQALRLLMAQQQWGRVMQVAQTFCKKSPLLNKEIFTTLLCEVAQHRDLDPYLHLLWVLCPEDLTVTTILNMVLKNLPSPNTLPSSPSFSMSSPPPSSPAPFADSQSSQLTIGLLKPLLRKVLQRETKPSQHYADILQSPSFPPPTPPRQPAEPPVTGTDSAVDDPAGPPPPTETSVQQANTHTAFPAARVALPANPV